MSAGKGAALQVRMGASQLAAFRSYADQNETTMSALVLGWIEAALAGSPPAPVSPAGAGSQPAAPEHLERLAQQVELLSSLQEQAVLQTQLLQQLTHQAAHTPYGGTGAELATETASSVEAPSFRAQLAAMRSGGEGVASVAPGPPAGWKAAGEGELVVGVKVYCSKNGAGVVTDLLASGLVLVKADGDSSMPRPTDPSTLFVSCEPKTDAAS